MRTATYITLSLICSMMIGCATATSTAGRDFDGTKVADIQKGVTTTKQLIAMFGEPYSKQVHSAEEVEWVYSWATATAKATSAFVSSSVKTKGYEKTLKLLIKDDVVVNYTYLEGPFERDTRSGTK